MEKGHKKKTPEAEAVVPVEELKRHMSALVEWLNDRIDGILEGRCREFNSSAEKQS